MGRQVILLLLLAGWGCTVFSAQHRSLSYGGILSYRIPTAHVFAEPSRPGLRIQESSKSQLSSRLRPFRRSLSGTSRSFPRPTLASNALDASSMSGTLSSASGWLLISLAVALHEGGHFMAAFFQSILIQEYSIGFGPKLISIGGKESTSPKFSLRGLPIGGYVAFPAGKTETKRMLSETPGYKKNDTKIDSTAIEFEDDDPDLLNNRPIPQQILVAAGGIVANILIAYIACVGAAVSGIPNPEYSNGILVGDVTKGGRAEMAGLQKGDLVMEVSGIPVTGDGVGGFVADISASPELPLNLKLKRGSDTINMEVTPALARDGKGRLSVTMLPNVADMRRTKASSVEEALQLGNSELFRITNDIIMGYSKLFQGGGGELVGPLTMAQIATTTMQTGDLSQTLLFFAALNMNLGAANALPIPGLDGGKLVTLLGMAIVGKDYKMSKQVEDVVNIATELAALGLLLFILNIFTSDLEKVPLVNEVIMRVDEVAHRLLDGLVQ